LCPEQVRGQAARVRGWLRAGFAGALGGALAAYAAPLGDFGRLSAIAGDWQANGSKGKPFTVTYRLMSADTVLVETYGVGSGHETMTVFHPDQARVLATHYCAQGNQPRLALQTAGPSRWVFAFLDATNLPDPSASHLVRLELALTDAGHPVRIETYLEKGKEDVSRLELIRHPPS
jgi:hypothetical protein